MGHIDYKIKTDPGRFEGGDSLKINRNVNIKLISTSSAIGQLKPVFQSLLSQIIANRTVKGLPLSSFYFAAYLLMGFWIGSISI